jgi:hypothetical protein
MAIKDILGKIGEGAEKAGGVLEKVGKTAGAVAQPVLKRAVEEEAGNLQELDTEGRQRKNQLADQQMAMKAQAVEQQIQDLTSGGGWIDDPTSPGGKRQLTGQELNDYQNKLVGDLTNIYSSPKDAPRLMQTFNRIWHPQGARAGKVAGGAGAAGAAGAGAGATGLPAALGAQAQVAPLQHPENLPPVPAGQTVPEPTLKQRPAGGVAAALEAGQAAASDRPAGAPAPTQVPIPAGQPYIYPQGGMARYNQQMPMEVQRDQQIKGANDAWNYFSQFIPQEQKAQTQQDWARKSLGLSSSLKPLTGSRPYKGADGRWYQSMIDSAGAISAQPMPEGYTPPPAKPGSPGSQYMNALVKMYADPTSLTSEDKAALKAYGKYVHETSVVPGEAKAGAYASSRRVQVRDPRNPDKLIYMSAGRAERTGASAPGSVGYQIEIAGHKAMIPKKLGDNLAAIGTAEEHITIMRGLVDALQSGDPQLINRATLAYKKATGNPAPTNYAMLKASFVGELSRSFTGVGQTIEEAKTLSDPLNAAGSWEQLSGALDTAQQAMESRKTNLIDVTEKAAQAQPLGRLSSLVNNPVPKAGGQGGQGGNGRGNRPAGATGQVTYQGKKYWVDKAKNNLGEVE